MVIMDYKSVLLKNINEQQCMQLPRLLPQRSINQQIKNNSINEPVNNKKRKRAGGIIRYVNNCASTDDETEEFIVVKNRQSGYYGFPKGQVENGEDNIQAAIREIEQETGLRIPITYQHQFLKFKGHTFYVITINKKIRTFDIKDTTEIEHACWMTLDELKMQDISVVTKKIINMYKRKYRNI